MNPLSNSCGKTVFVLYMNYSAACSSQERTGAVLKHICFYFNLNKTDVFWLELPLSQVRYQIKSPPFLLLCVFCVYLVLLGPDTSDDILCLSMLHVTM